MAFDSTPLHRLPLRDLQRRMSECSRGDIDVTRFMIGEFTLEISNNDSGTLDRVYRVINHSETDIGFQNQLTKSTSEPYDLWRIANMELGGREDLSQLVGGNEDETKNLRRKGEKDKKKSAEHIVDPIVDPDEPPKFKDSRIAIRGYLRQGRLSFRVDTGKWQLIPVPHHSPRSNSTVLGREPEDAFSNVGSDSSFALSEVFPDVKPGSTEEQHHCWLVILAYSRNEDLVCTFSGVGLMLEELKGGRSSLFPQDWSHPFQ